MSYFLDQNLEGIKFCDGCKQPMSESLLQSIDWKSELGKLTLEYSKLKKEMLQLSTSLTDSRSKYTKIKDLESLDNKIVQKQKILSRLTKKYDSLDNLEIIERTMNSLNRKCLDLEQEYKNKVIEKETELKLAIKESRDLYDHYNSLISKYQHFFHFYTIDNVIDLDSANIDNKFITHLKNDHQIALIRQSSSKKHFHIITDSSNCSTCETQGDYEFFNIVMQSRYLFLFNEKWIKTKYWKNGPKYWKKSQATYWTPIQNFDIKNLKPIKVTTTDNQFKIVFSSDYKTVEQNLYRLFLLTINELYGFFISFTIPYGSLVKHGFGIFDSEIDLILTVSEFKFKKIRLFMHTSIIDFKCNLTKNRIYTENLSYHYCQRCKIPDFECECNTVYLSD